MYNLKIVQCGSNRIEIYKVNNYVIRDGEGKREVKTGTEPTGKQSLKDRKRTLHLTRNNIVRLIKCNPDMQTFITLTFKDELDYKESKKCLNNLFNKLRRKYSYLKYLWVLEYGDINGRLHYHLLCNIPVNIKLSSSKEKKSQEHKNLEQWFEKKFWKHGFVDIRNLGQEDNTNIALYVSSYIVKSMSNVNLEGYRVMGYSHKTLDKPVIEKYYSKASIEDILERYINKYDLTFCSTYDVGYTNWKGEYSGTVSYYDFMKKGNEL